MTDVFKEWIDIFATGGPWAMLIASWWIFWKVRAEDKGDCQRMREAYQSVVKDKDAEIAAERGRVEALYKDQNESLGRNVGSMVEALTNVNASNAAVVRALEKLEIDG